MLSILERMNPAVCLGGSLSTIISDVKEDVVTDSQDQARQDQESSNNGHSNNRKSSFSCMSSPNCNSKYQPNDKEEPLPSDMELQSLSRTVPELLVCISTLPPTSVANGTPQKDMRKSIRECNNKRTSALQNLYELTQKGKEYNRVPLVCNTEHWDVVGVLSEALLVTTSEIDKQLSKGKPSVDEDRRLICWTLNNLSIPYENKAAIALGEHSAKLLHALTMVIQSNLPETYLCCICLLNLTFLADAIRPTTFYVPSSHDDDKAPYSSPRSRAASSHNDSSIGKETSISPLGRSRSLRLKSRTLNGKHLWSESEGRISEICGLVLGNSSSLIRVIERMMLTNAPFLLSTVQSVQGEAIRWSCGFIRNVTYGGEANTKNGKVSSSTGRQGIIPNESIEEICILISQTEIPRVMVKFVKDSPSPTVEWTKDSLEDICLGAMCNMAQWQSSQEALKRAGALQCLEKIEGLPGIHGYRARAIRCSLGALPMRFG